jgi:predicted metal-dependent phosphoesterase TrpH
MELDCIAITNHNLFDKNQFETISATLKIPVLPGIEIDLEGGHILLDLFWFDYQLVTVNNFILLSTL